MKIKTALTHPAFIGVLGVLILATLIMLLRGAPVSEYKASGVNTPAQDPASFPIQVDPRYFNQRSVRLLEENAYQARRFTATPQNRGVQSTSGAATAGQGNAVPPAPAVPCAPEKQNMLLGEVVLTDIRWRNPRNGETGCGTKVPHLAKTGHFWFFNDQNIELTCKALNGLPVNNSYWIFCGGLTDVEWWMTAINNANPNFRKQYYNPPNTMASFGDTEAFGNGENKAPAFGMGRCGRLYDVQRGAFGVMEIATIDSNGDNLNVTARVLEGNMEINPEWSNPLPGTNQNILLHFDLPNEPGEYWFAFEADDGKVYMPTLCTVGLRAR